MGGGPPADCFHRRCTRHLGRDRRGSLKKPRVRNAEIAGARVENEITIRAARPGDARFLGELLGQLGYPAKAEDIPSRLFALQDFPKALALVAVHRESVVGLVTAHIIPAIHASEPIALLTTLVVATSHRGQGIGSQLVSEVERWAAAHHAVRISVTSGLQREDSHQFYEQRNYQRSGLRFTKALAG